MPSTLPGTNSTRSRRSERSTDSSKQPQKKEPAKRRRYVRLEDGEWYDQPEYDRVACCDCGLVHDVWWERTAHGIRMRHYRNARATAQVRRAMMRRGEL